MLTKEDIYNQTKNKAWVSPFEKIIGFFDPTRNVVQIYEYHARNSCYGAAAWAVYHYQQTSPLIISAYRDGARDIFTLKLGEQRLKLKPSYSSAGIEKIEVKGDDLHIKYSGLAGGGVGSSLCRGLANGVKGVTIHALGGGGKLGSATLTIPIKTKLHIGVDDTDRPGTGATWSLANEIAFKLNEDKDIDYINHTLVQLYPGTPEKTTNCVATVLTFAVKSTKLDYLKSRFLKDLKELTSSENTGVAFFKGIIIPKKLKSFTTQARKSVVELSDAKYFAEKLGIEMLPVTGTRGQIGALAALGLAEKQEIAVKPAI